MCNKLISKMKHVSFRLHTGWKRDIELQISTPNMNKKVTERSREMKQIIKLQSTYIVQYSKYHTYV